MDGVQAPPATTAATSPVEEAVTTLYQRVDALSEAVQAIAAAGGTSKREDLASRVGGLQQSAEIGELAMALAAAQAELPNPGLNKTAKVDLKGGGGYQHKFADLPEILGTIRPILGKHGLSFIQAPTLIAGGTFLVTRLMHSSGQWLQTALPLPSIGSGRIQEWGGIVTFTKRYAIGALIGIAGAEDDDDGNVADGNNAHITDRHGNPVAQPGRLPRGAAAAARKAADDEADRAAAVAEIRRRPPSDQPGDPGPGGDGAAPKAGEDAQKALRELSKGLKAFFDPVTGEINVAGAEEAWLAASHHMLGVPQHTVDSLVDRYRNTFKHNPPPVDGVTYPEVAPANA